MKTIRSVFAVLAIIGLNSGEVAADEPVPPAPAADANVQEQFRQLSNRLTALERQLQNQSLLTLFNQVSALRSEVSRLRGQQEEALHVQQVSEKRVKDLYADIDGRLRAVAKAATTVTGTSKPQAQGVTPAVAASAPKPVVVSPAVDQDADGKAYEAALGLLKDGSYAAAAAAFQSYILTYPNAPLVANALYWLGLSQFSQGDLKGAELAQQRLLKDYPQNPKAADAMVNLARIHIQQGETDAGRSWLDKVIAEHPSSKAADTARKMQELNK